MRDLVRWNPFHELTHWHRDMDDLFALPFLLEQDEDLLFRWRAAWDVYE